MARREFRENFDEFRSLPSEFHRYAAISTRKETLDKEEKFVHEDEFNEELSPALGRFSADSLDLPDSTHRPLLLLKQLAALILISGFIFFQIRPPFTFPNISGSPKDPSPPLVHNHVPDKDWTVVEEPTCTEDGYEILTCKECGEQLEERRIPATGHKPSIAWYVEIATTCTEEGLAYQICTVCGAHLDTKVIVATGHHPSDEWIVLEQPNCTEDGLQVKECTVCHELCLKKTIHSLGHTPAEEWEVIQEPTCTEEGKRVLLCTVCGEVLQEESIELAEHTPAEDWEITKEATCVEEGTKVIKCTECGEILEEDTIVALGHIPADIWRILEAATCTSTGIRVLRCTRCNEVLLTGIIDALGHNYELVETHAATCDHEGYELERCSRCGDERRTILPQIPDHVFYVPTIDDLFDPICMYCGKRVSELGGQADPTVGEDENGNPINYVYIWIGDKEYFCTFPYTE